MPGLLDFFSPSVNDPVKLAMLRRQKLDEMRHNADLESDYGRKGYDTGPQAFDGSTNPHGMVANRQNYASGATRSDIASLEDDMAADPYTGIDAQRGQKQREAELANEAAYMSPGTTDVRKSKQKDKLSELLAVPAMQGESALAVQESRNRGNLDVAHETGLANVLASKARTGGMMASSLKERVAGTGTSLDTLGRLQNNFKDEFVGPVAGRARAFGQALPLVPVNKDFARFSADSATLKNAVIKAITGAQMSEPEAKRISEQIPMVSDKPEVWHAKAAATQQNLRDMLRRIAELHGQQPQEQDDDPYSDPNWGMQ